MALVERYHSSQELKDAIAREGPKPGIQQCKESKSLPGNKQGISLVHSEERAKHVGILALEVYFPDTYVRHDIPSQYFWHPGTKIPCSCCGAVPHNGSLKARKANLLRKTSPAACLCIESMSRRALQVSQKDLKAYDRVQPTFLALITEGDRCA